MIRHLMVVIPLLVSGLAQASAQKVADPAVGEVTTATSGPRGPRFEETGPQTSFTIGLIRSLFFSAVLFGEPWLEVSMERRLSHTLGAWG